jgi:chromosome segregation ATPase
MEGGKEMSNADDFRGLTRDIANAQRERTRRIAEIRGETAGLLNRFDKEHRAMGQQMRAGLGKVKSELARAKPEIAAAESERKSQTKAEMKEMASQLRVELGKVKSELARVKPEIAAAESERKSQAEAEKRARKSDVSRLFTDVSSLLEGFRRDSAEMAAAWRELVATMQATRGVAVAPRPVKPRKVAAAVGEEVLGEKANPKEPEKKVRLEEQILSLIGEHPDGIKLTEIAERTGVARIKAGNVTRMLVDEGKVIKEGLFYFPV